MKNKRTLQSVLICLFVVVTLAVCNSPARAACTTTTWTGTVGDWLSSETLAVLGTLTPTGTMTIAGNLNLREKATTVCNVTPPGADNVQVVQSYQGREGTSWGHAALNGRLTVMMTGDFNSAPNRFTLLHADSGIDPDYPKFASVSIKYPTDQGWTPRITYDYQGGNVYIDRVYNLDPNP